MQIRMMHIIRRGIFLLSIMALLSLTKSTAPAAVFGRDDRVEASARPVDFLQTKATAMWTPNLDIISVALLSLRQDAPWLRLDFTSLNQTLGVCSNEKFALQPAAPVSCTGFLVASDLLLTAGHCSLLEGEVREVSNPFCTDFKWLFNFALDSAGRLPDLNRIPTSDVVGCKKILYAVHDPLYNVATDSYSFRRDFALVQLDHEVKDHPQIRLSRDGVQFGDRLTLIGYPSGLPAKIAEGQVTENQDANFFSR